MDPRWMQDLFSNGIFQLVFAFILVCAMISETLLLARGAGKGIKRFSKIIRDFVRLIHQGPKKQGLFLSSLPFRYLTCIRDRGCGTNHGHGKILSSFDSQN